MNLVYGFRIEQKSQSEAKIIENKKQCKVKHTRLIYKRQNAYIFQNCLRRKSIKLHKYPIIPSKFLWTEGRSRFLVICSHSATGLLSYLETCFPAAFRDKRFSKASKYHARSTVSDISEGIENIINAM